MPLRYYFELRFSLLVLSSPQKLWPVKRNRDKTLSIAIMHSDLWPLALSDHISDCVFVHEGVLDPTILASRLEL